MRRLTRTGVTVTMLAAMVAAAGCGGLRVGPRGIVQAYPAISDDQIRAAIALPSSEEKSVAVHRGLWGNFDGDEHRHLALVVEVIEKTGRATGRAAKPYVLETTADGLGATGEVRGHAFVAAKDELVYAKDMRPGVRLSMGDAP